MSGDEARELDERGYTVLEGLISDAWLNEIRRRIEEVFEEEGENAGHKIRQEPHARRLTNLVDMGEVFERVAGNERVLELVEHVLGREYKLSSLNARSTNPYAPEGHPLHVGQGLLPDGHGNIVCNSLWMLDDFTSENGATRVTPASHRWGERPEEVMADTREPHPDEALITGKAGTVVVYNGHLWRGGTSNRTGRHQRAVHGSYVRRDYPQMEYQRRLLKQATQERLPPALRRLLALDDRLNDDLCSRVTGQSGLMK